jgi:hypothetical protein
MTPAQFEDERLRLKAARISQSFHRRVAELEARRGGGLVDGLAEGWSDADWLHPRLQMVLRRFARIPHRRGNAYVTTLNGVAVAVLRSGRIVIHDKGAR